MERADRRVVERLRDREHHRFTRHRGGRASDEIFPAGDGEVVLVIDDEPTIRMLVAEILGESGYSVIKAPDGPTGLRELVSNTRIDLLITNVGLPAA